MFSLMTSTCVAGERSWSSIKAAAKQRDAKSGEVVRADGNLAYGRSRLAGRVRFTFSVKRIREFEQVGRQAHGYAGRFNAGRIFDAPKELLVKRRNLWCVCVEIGRAHV